MFWNNFYRLCKEHGTTPNAVCKELGLSSATATHWKNGASPRMSVLEQIAKRFDTTVSALLMGNIDVDIYNESEESKSKTKEIEFPDHAYQAIIMNKKALPVETTRSEMFEILSQLTDEEMDDLIKYARFLLSKR